MSEDYSPAILIVDDVAENIQIVAGVLKNEGYSMAFATSGKAALEIAGNGDFDLVLLDVMMPEMDGFEVCKRLKSAPETAGATVIFLTAKTDVESIVNGFSVGGSDYITKPFNTAELSARVKTHLQLKLHERRLQQLNAAKDRFISIIAQELKGPFTGLNGVLTMIDEEYDRLDPEIIRDYLALSRKASNQLLGLLDNLLTWSTLQTEGLPYTPRIIDLSALTSDTLNEVIPVLNGKKIGFINQIRDGSFAFADEEMVRIVLKNLFANAAMFTHEGGKVAVSGKADDKRLTISVEDTGIGMSQEETSNLFKIDKRVKRKGTAGEMGTGMGLILCRELVEKNGGEIWLTSLPEQGTQVYFTLPRSQSSANSTIN